MEKNSEVPEIIEKKDKDADYSGYSERQADLDVDKRTGQAQQHRRSQTMTQQTVLLSARNHSGKKKAVTVFQKNPR